MTKRTTRPDAHLSGGVNAADGARLVCLGHGYVAKAFAERLSAARTVGTTRSARDMGAGGEALSFDGKSVSDALRAALADATHVLISIPPDAQGCPAARACAGLLSKSAELRWLGYLSATSVYGDRGGGWAFEDDPLTPTAERGRRRALAEAQWREGVAPAHVFRLPGIYGPGRSALARVREGTATRTVKPGLVFNRAHVDDIARALARSAAKPTPGLAFNIADDEPAPPQDVVEEAARLLGVAPPPDVAFEDADLSPMARAFYGDSKRLSNARLKAVLGWRPAYPTYREGLAAILAST